MIEDGIEGGKGPLWSWPSFGQLAGKESCAVVVVVAVAVGSLEA